MMRPWLCTCRAEAAASEEAAMAERAAKFAAEAEAKATQDMLERVQTSLEVERGLAAKVGRPAGSVGGSLGCII